MKEEVQEMEEKLKNIPAILENKNREHNRLMSELQQITEVSKKDKLKLTQLQSEVTDTQNKIKGMREVEQNLKNELESQKKVSSQPGNPQYDYIKP